MFRHDPEDLVGCLLCSDRLEGQLDLFFHSMEGRLRQGLSCCQKPIRSLFARTHSVWNEVHLCPFSPCRDLLSLLILTEDPLPIPMGHSYHRKLELRRYPMVCFVKAILFACLLKPNEVLSF